MRVFSKLKSVDFYRRIPRDLTEASFSGASLSIIAALAIVFLFATELNNYMKPSTTTSVVIDRSRDSEMLRIQFNMSFPSLSCEFASVDVSDVLGLNKFNITKTVKKYPIDHSLRKVGPEVHPDPIHVLQNTGADEDHDHESSVPLQPSNFDDYLNRYDVLVVNFYHPGCKWCRLLAPSWEKAAYYMSQRYPPYTERILLAKVNCQMEDELCREHHVQAYPSIRIFHKKGHSDVMDEHGRHQHDSYYGERDTESIVKAMELLVLPEHHPLALEGQNSTVKRPAPKSGGCRIEGYIRAKKVPGNIIISAHSGSHTFDVSIMNMTHYVHHFYFGHPQSFEMRNEMYRLHPDLQGVYGVNDMHNLLGRLFYSAHPNITHDHYLQVVKTEVMSLAKKTHHKELEQYDYISHSSHFQNEELPVAKFHYELSPMQVIIKENEKSFWHFITNICAIIGGVFTVAGIIDGMLHQAASLVRKVELGKQF